MVVAKAAVVAEESPFDLARAELAETLARMFELAQEMPVVRVMLAVRGSPEHLAH